jgi:lon-related putative ATP-dependent protease
MTFELSSQALYRACDPASLGCETSAEVNELGTIIGQERAVRAMRFGLDIQDKGFNIFVAGVPGTGRTTAIERFLTEVASRQPAPSDWCYVNNFGEPLQPNALRLPAGKARKLKADLEGTIRAALSDLRAAFESEEFTSHKEELMNAIQSQKQELFNQLGQRAEQEGFVLQPTPMGLLTIPTKAGRPITEEEFLHLSEEERADITQRQQRLKVTLEEATRSAKNLDKFLREKLETLQVQVAQFAIQNHFTQLSSQYTGIEEIPEHIQAVAQDILKNVGELTSPEEEPPPPFGKGRPRQSPAQRYAVNILVDNAALQGAPVVVETNPTYTNLIGRVEHEAVFGALVTNHSLIRPGCLHRANGGYLVLPVEDVLRNPYAWETLKRAINEARLVIEDLGERIGFATQSLRPEPIPLRVKVVLIGRPDLYQLLLRFDEQFSELFKVKADFDTLMPRSDEHVQEYLSFVCTLCRNEKLRHLGRSALARIIEHASRLAADQEKLSTRFGEMADVIREANYYAGREAAEVIQAAHVEQAIEARLYRSGLLRDRLQEVIARGEVRIDVHGQAVGQVNGLSVLSLGDIAFGQPSRITASLALGKDGVINIEREAELSGPIHTKGVLILSGYLGEKYAQDKPLSLSARLVFEQSYAGVEGDSASSTELYALLSALSGLPIRQGIAVTGSVNQKGEVQVIGGVNEKIEGFFETCQLKGLDGSQGVMIPAGNAAHLMLKGPVVEAVRRGQFHIWAVNTIDEGIEILTGVPAGRRGADGAFEAGTVNARVDARLAALAERLARYGKEAGEGAQ